LLFARHLPRRGVSPGSAAVRVTIRTPALSYGANFLRNTNHIALVQYDSVFAACSREKSRSERAAALEQR
jgi:hypothetical protein